MNERMKKNGEGSAEFWGPCAVPLSRDDFALFLIQMSMKKLMPFAMGTFQKM